MMQQQQQQQTQQQSAQLSVPSLSQQQQQQLQALGETKSSAGTSNHPSLTQIAKADDSDEYDDSEEKSTEPPKKHKHKKGKSKSKDLDKSAEPIEEASASQHSTASKTTSNSVKTIKTAVSPVHEQYEIIHQNMALEFRDHDGQSERPGGAVLSLTLGLLITAALAILIGCRMRTVGRRARRMGGKTPYSHEADFLVNGMYL
uniref:Rubella capsid protein n=1 Tax=Musca domestica TaxID=7370 RepID=T1PJ20_MUSDO